MSPLDAIAGEAEGGKLYGIGVGPGDIRYLTLRAASLIRSVDIIAYFAKRGHEGNSRTTIALLLEEGRREQKFEYPFTDEIPVADAQYRDAISAFYDEMAASLRSSLDEGLSVGLLSEGDPFFYGSFMHIWRRLEGDYPVEVVPGVTSMSGCWTRAKTPITWGDDVLAVLPGTLSEERLAQRLASVDAAVIMKVGRNLAKICRAVEAAGLMSRAVYVERGTMAAERIVPLRECKDSVAPYFAMVLIPGLGRRL